MKIPCDLCNKILKEPGGIVLSPPGETGLLKEEVNSAGNPLTVKQWKIINNYLKDKVKKHHVCIECYKEYIDSMFAGNDRLHFNSC